MIPFEPTDRLLLPLRSLRLCGEKNSRRFAPKPKGKGIKGKGLEGKSIKSYERVHAAE